MSITPNGRNQMSELITADDMETKALECRDKGNFSAAASYFRVAAQMFRADGQIEAAINAQSMMRRATRDASLQS